MAELLTLTLSFASGDRPARLALPDGPGPHAAVVVIHDVLGFKRDTERHCLNFADAGYAAIAPDLYGGGRARCVVSTLLSMRRGEGEAYTVISEARRVLVAREDVDADRIGITGFCAGGGFALIAAADDTYAVAAPFYGSVPRSARRLEGICPTLAQYGSRDRMFARHGRRLARHLEALGVEHEVIFHPGVGHSFMNDHPGVLMAASAHLPPMFAGHDAAAEATAWARLLEFFERHMPPA